MAYRWVTAAASLLWAFVLPILFHRAEKGRTVMDRRSENFTWDMELVDAQTYSMELHHWSHYAVNEQTESPVFLVGGVDWYILCYPRGMKNLKGWLALYLSPTQDSLDRFPGLTADFTIALQNDEDLTRTIIRRWAQFANLPALESSGGSSGYLLNDSLSLKVTIDAIQQPKELVEEIARAGNQSLLVHRSLSGRSRATGVFKWTLPNLSQAKDRMVSPEFLHGGGYWQLVCFPRGNGASDLLSIYLTALYGQKGRGWDPKAMFALTVSSQYNPSLRIMKRWRDFARLSDIWNPKAGFVVNDTIVIQVGIVEDFDGIGVLGCCLPSIWKPSFQGGPGTAASHSHTPSILEARFYYISSLSYLILAHYILGACIFYPSLLLLSRLLSLLEALGVEKLPGVSILLRRKRKRQLWLQTVRAAASAAAASMPGDPNDADPQPGSRSGTVGAASGGTAGGTAGSATGLVQRKRSSSGAGRPRNSKPSSQPETPQEQPPAAAQLQQQAWRLLQILLQRLRVQLAGWMSCLSRLWRHAGSRSISSKRPARAAGKAPAARAGRGRGAAPGGGPALQPATVNGASEEQRMGSKHRGRRRAAAGASGGPKNLHLSAAIAGAGKEGGVNAKGAARLDAAAGEEEPVGEGGAESQAVTTTAADTAAAAAAAAGGDGGAAPAGQQYAGSPSPSAQSASGAEGEQGRSPASGQPAALPSGGQQEGTNAAGPLGDQQVAAGPEHGSVGADLQGLPLEEDEELLLPYLLPALAPLAAAAEQRPVPAPAPTAARERQQQHSLQAAAAEQQRAASPLPSPLASPQGPLPVIGAGAEGSECVMCWERERETALAPCGHVALCLPCTRQVLAAGRPGAPASCPVCRSEISTYIQQLYYA